MKTDLTQILSRRHLPALDGIRMVAVMMVIVGHSYASVPADLGVSAFFVLSGFLITWLLLAERGETGTISLRRFYLRRTLRIFPAYYAFLFLSFLLDSYLGDTHSGGAMVSALFYVVNYFNALHGHPTTTVAHAWSLAVEEQFYVIWPILFLLLSFGGRRRLIQGLFAAILLVVGWRSFLWFHVHIGAAYVYNAFDTRFDNLAVGCLLAVWLSAPKTAGQASVLGRRWWAPIVTLALLLTSRLATTTAWHYSLGFTVDAFLLATLLVQFLQLSAGSPWRWLDRPVSRYLGKISYPMYLYHAWGMGAGRRAPVDNHELKFLLGVGVTVALATASYYLIERPFLRLKDRFEPPVRLSDRESLRLLSTSEARD